MSCAHALPPAKLQGAYLLGLGLNGSSPKCISLIFCLNSATPTLVLSYCTSFLFISLPAPNTMIYIFLLLIHLPLLESGF